MRKLKTLSFLFLALLFGLTAHTQVPETMNYQAVLRDNSGMALPGESIMLQVDIHESSLNGAVVYSEQHSLTTNELGMIEIAVGDGSSSSGSLSALNWGAERHYLTILLSIDGGDWLEFGTSELLTVPYAFHANTVENADDADADPENELITEFILSGSSLELTEGGTTTSVDLSGLGGGEIDLDADPANELQSLSIDGYTLSISEGNSVPLPMSAASPLLSDANGHNYQTGNLGIGQESDPGHSVIVTTTTNGLLAQTTGSGKFGLKGRATDGNEESIAVMGWADNGGRAIVGWTENNIAVEGVSWTFEEKGYGGHFTARGPEGVGVFGENTYDGSGYGFGGYFVSHADTGTGVYGRGESPYSIGVHGVSAEGIGVKASGDTALYADGLYAVVGYSEDFWDGKGAGGYFISTNRAVVGRAEGSGGHGPGGTYDPAPAGSYIGGDFTGIVSDAMSGTSGTGVKAQGGRYGVDATGHTYGIKGEAYSGVIDYGGGSETPEDAAGVTGIGSLYAHGVYGSATEMPGVKGVGPTGVEGEGTNYDFYAAGAGTNFGPFTGAHDVLISEESASNLKAGMVVTLTGKVEQRVKDGKVSISSTLPWIKLADKEKDKAVFGVLVKEKKLNKDHWYKDKDARAGIVNALGEGRVWVYNAGANIEAGDYITTSSVSGYAMKQGDDLLHNYTLAKATETIDWSNVSETVTVNGKTYKVYLLAVVYVSG